MMIANRFEDLVVWQLAVALRRLVYRMTRSGPVMTDVRFRKSDSKLREFGSKKHF
jgi:hypothetical protein